MKLSTLLVSFLVLTMLTAIPAAAGQLDHGSQESTGDKPDIQAILDFEQAVFDAQDK